MQKCQVTNTINANCAHIQEQIYEYANIRRYTYTNFTATKTQRCKYTKTHSLTNIHIYKDTKIQLYECTIPFANTYTHIHQQKIAPIHLYPNTHIHKQAYTHMRTYTYKSFHICKHTSTQIHTYEHTQLYSMRIYNDTNIRTITYRKY